MAKDYVMIVRDPMKFLFLIILASFLVTAPAPLVLAMDCKGSACSSCHTLSKEEATTLLKKTGGTVKSVKMAPVKGMFELLMEKEGKQGLVYIDFSKKYLLQGFIVDFENLHTVAAHTDDLPQFKNATGVDIKNMPVKNALVMGNRKGNKKIYVFTDPDCPYCRTLHTELKKLVKLVPDLSVYIMLYPLPMHPGAYDKSRAILTSKKQATLDKAFAGGDVPKVGTKDGVGELNEIVNFARKNGLAATPSIVLPDGIVLSGLKTAEELQAILNGN